MTDMTPQKRVLPARERRESTVKRRAASPSRPATPNIKDVDSPVSTDSRPKRKYTKRVSVVHIATPTRSVSTPVSNTSEILPTKVTSTRPLPVSSEKQSEDLSRREYQSVADSAILAASLHRSRIQWLCDGIFKKYWTKPVRRKGVVEQLPNNPDQKSMQKLGNATITIEPHTFDATFYVVREAQVTAPPSYKPLPQAVQPAHKANISAPSSAATGPSMQSPVHTPALKPMPATAATPISKPASGAQSGSNTPTPSVATSRPPTPPGGAKTTDPVIQMLASRAASDNHLKELMKVVAGSRATQEQLKEFQAHIDEFTAIVKKQEVEQEAKAKLAASKPASTPPSQQPVAARPATYNTIHRNSPLNPALGAQYTSYPMQPRPEPIIKHIVIEFTSPPSAGQSASTDRWLFPEQAVLDTQYGGSEMVCSFFVERKGSDVLASMKDLTSEEMQSMSNKWRADTEYYQPVTMTIRASQHRTIETIARSAKPLSEMQKHMQDVMEKKSRAPQEYLVYRLPKDKVDVSSGGFFDSAVEMSASSGEDDELKDFYPL